jgi:hypothetical protein
VLPSGAATSESRDRPLASLWWPGAVAVALGVLSVLGARRTRRGPAGVDLDAGVDGVATVSDDATVKHDVLVDLEAAEREAHAPAERMAVQLERLRTTAPPVPRRRSHL